MGYRGVSMPANCITLGSDPMVLRSPGQLDKARTTALTFHDLSLPAGDSVFEIAMMAAGVGTCVVPLRVERLRRCWYRARICGSLRPCSEA